MLSMSDEKPVYATVDSAKHRRDSVMTADCQRAHRTPIRRPLSLSASRRRLGPIGHGYLGSESLTGGVRTPDRTRSWVHRAHRFLRILTFLFLLCLPVFAQASLGSWVKGVLHLGKYSETVATEVATLPEDHGTWGLAFSPHGRYLAASMLCGPPRDQGACMRCLLPGSGRTNSPDALGPTPRYQFRPTGRVESRHCPRWRGRCDRRLGAKNRLVS